jgi:hypothetical protein
MVSYSHYTKLNSYFNDFHCWCSLLGLKSSAKGGSLTGNDETAVRQKKVAGKPKISHTGGAL